ncbi:MAG: HIT family protein [Candidatus Colwellbacteria bacterium]|jgi:histidine triad (HIT) family protein|nr:HIT family protein [Candidatus Colwellbacteria bacterium]MCK9497738.1 HIT family protein [Candidatus Colwellbacteria bacterium]MDD3752694.1 HIT family protein [Candidatus Colwellbacteria bacterium]MDD4818843.1 HIT family protein [Candidatus Colwellbacteria bacterium]
MDCLFCKIASKEIPSSVIYEDDVALAFLDLHPLAPGHALVIPKIHAENILDLPEELIGPFFQSVKKVTALIKEKLAPRGFTIGINQGRIGGQAIDHLHVHIIPRFEGDGGGSLHSVVKNPPKESLEEIQAKIAG